MPLVKRPLSVIIRETTDRSLCITPLNRQNSIRPFHRNNSRYQVTINHETEKASNNKIKKNIIRKREKISIDNSLNEIFPKSAGSALSSIHTLDGYSSCVPAIKPRHRNYIHLSQYGVTRSQYEGLDITVLIRCSSI